MQKTFSGVDANFRWVEQSDGTFWYEWDPAAARQQALRARNLEAKELRRAGHNVSKFSLGDQILTKGGIGTPYPEITIVAKVYGINYR